MQRYKLTTTWLCPLIVGTSLLAFPATMLAAARTTVPVVESLTGTYQPSTTTALPAQAPALHADTQLQWLDRLATLEQEVRDLRGQLEVNEHKIEQLTQQQRALYQDLDRRLSQRVSPEKVETKTATAPTNTPVKADKQPSLDEKKAYQAAYRLLQQKEYPQAITAFTELLSHYPSGFYPANAHYWLGELYLVNGDYTAAQMQFSTVLESYPKHSKTADALLKLGYVYAAQGQKDKAVHIFNQVKAQYPETTVAQLADKQLRRLY